MITTPSGLQYDDTVAGDGATARAVAQVADAVVIGTRLVQVLESEPRDNVANAARDFMAGIRSAMDTKEQGANA